MTIEQLAERIATEMIRCVKTEMDIGPLTTCQARKFALGILEMTSKDVDKPSHIRYPRKS